MKANVYLVDDDPMILESVSWVLEGEGITAYPFSAAQEFLDHVDFNQPGCAVLDINMPGMDGIELHRRIVEEQPVISVIFLTGHADVPITADAFKRGAIDVLQKPVETDALLCAILHGCKISEQNAQNHKEYRQAVERFQTLTPREKELFKLVIEGLPNKVIADTLCIALRTAEIHRHNLFKKMKVTSAIQLARLAHLLDKS